MARARKPTGVVFLELDDDPSVKWATFPARRGTRPTRYWARLLGSELLFGNDPRQYEEGANGAPGGDESIKFDLTRLARAVRRAAEGLEAAIPRKGSFRQENPDVIRFRTTCGESHYVRLSDLLEVIEDAEGQIERR